LRGAVMLVALTALALPASAGAEVTPVGVDFRAASPAGPSVFFDHGGLQLTGSCAAGPDLAVTASTTAENATIQANVHPVAPTTGFASDGNFDPGDSFDVFAGFADGTRTGQLVYSTRGGTHVTVEWMAMEPPLIDGFGECLFAATAEVAGRGQGGSESRRRVDYRADSGSPKRTFFEAGGLSLKGSCDGGDLNVTARSSADHAVVHANSQGPGTVATYAGDDDFGPGDPFRLTRELGAAGSGVGQLIFVSRNGNVVTADWLSRGGGVYGGTRDCAFVGSARVLDSESRDALLFKPKKTEFVPPGKRGGGSQGHEFFRRGNFSASGTCSQGPDLTVFIGFNQDEVNATAVQFDPNDQFHAFGSGGGGSGGAFQVTVAADDRVAGNAIAVLGGGDLLSVDWLGEEKNAFGGRRPCLFAGSAEYLPD
jgi:hypothetical protein